jgi:hypothetical protein
MSDEIHTDVLQSMLQYYRSKCSQLEYEFLLYKLKSEKELDQLRKKDSK